MHDASAVEYLDDLLGHPERDPHGQEIPEDEACTIPGNVVPLSYFRTGREGVIEKVPEDAADTGLVSGDKVRMEGRQHEGKSWFVTREDGTKIILDHDTADKILVKCA
jgi:hypothetical protein